MSAEPDNTIEKALRDYARRRREQPGAPKDLHAVNRRLLQSEVQRSYGPSSHSNPQAEKRLAWWFRWQGLASLGSAVLAVCVGVIWWASQNSGSQMELALGSTPSQPSENRRSLAEAPALDQLSQIRKRGESEQPTASRSSVAAPPPATVSPLALSPSPPPAVVDSSAARTVAPDALEVRSKPSAESVVVPPTPGLASAPLATPSSPVAGQERDRADFGGTSIAAKDLPTPAQPARVETLHFRQVSEAMPLSKRDLGRAPSLERDQRQTSRPAPPVLNEFRMTHSQGQLTILDQDGSEYRGYLSAAPEPARFGLAPATKPSIRGTSAAEAGSQRAGPIEPVSSTQYRFLATGTNRSLQQPLKLEGELRSSLPLQSQAVSNTPGSVPITIKSPTALAGTTATTPAHGLSWEFQSAVSIGTQRPINLKAIQIPPDARSLPPPVSPSRPNR